ncbi:MAG: hypothetical protein D6822_00145 [Cyanobacteria bacterium J149]|nr:MAG: hypothetical protein D6822_00145 [Cyanobacteria bacterium J149]
MPRRSKADELLTKAKNMWERASNARKKLDWKWYLYDLWVKGYHYARYDKRLQQVVSRPSKDGRPKVVINKIYPTLRSVRNYVLRNRPKAEVVPDKINDDSLLGSMKATKFLDYIHDTERLRYKLKATLWQALEFSVGWWQVIWDGENIRVNPIDTFDFYPDPRARTAREMRYAIVAVRRSLEDLKEDDKYDKKEVEKIKADNKLAGSSFKEMLLSFDQGSFDGSKDGTVIVKEIWYKENGKVYVMAEAGGRIIRQPEEVDTKILPFFLLPSDVMPFSLYGEGWVKHMIDPQRLLNSAMSSIAEYNVLMNKIKFIADKGAGVRVINNKHGQIIEKKRGYNVTTQPVAPLNQAIYQQIELSNLFIEDIGAMHDASRGRVPTGAKSGRAIEALQLGDSNNMSELVENVEMFLEDVFEYILWLAANKYQDMRQIVVSDYLGQRSYIKVIGETSPIAQDMLKSGNIPENTLIIPEKNVVDVKISSYLAYTPEAKRESVKELATIIQDLPEDVILDAYGVGNIAEVIQKIKEKRREKQQQEIEAQKAQAQAQQEVQRGPQQGPQEAIAAIRTMIQGGMPQVPTNPSQEYIDTFDQFLERESRLGELDSDTIDAIRTFRDQVVQGVGR